MQAFLSKPKFDKKLIYSSPTMLLDENHGFLPPVTRSKGNHYLNPIHILEYFDKIKLPNYDACCPSVSKELHQRLTCNICFKYFPTINFIKIQKRKALSKQSKK